MKNNPVTAGDDEGHMIFAFNEPSKLSSIAFHSKFNTNSLLGIEPALCLLVDPLSVIYLHFAIAQKTWYKTFMHVFHVEIYCYQYLISGNSWRL